MPQHLSDEGLKEMQQVNWETLDRHLNWDRFAGQMIEAIESDVSLSCSSEHFSRKLRIRWAAMISPYSTLRPRMFIASVRAFVRSIKDC